jgi:hypothetical protein
VVVFWLLVHGNLWVYGILAFGFTGFWCMVFYGSMVFSSCGEVIGWLVSVAVGM